MQTLLGSAGGNAADVVFDIPMPGLFDSKCFSLTKKQRLYGFLICFIAGCVASIFSTIFLTTFNYTAFGVVYTAGNITAIFSTAFIIGEPHVKLILATAKLQTGACNPDFRLQLQTNVMSLDSVCGAAVELRSQSAFSPLVCDAHRCRTNATIQEHVPQEARARYASLPRDAHCDACGRL